MDSLRLLTRGSALALAQSRWVAEQLQSAHPGLTVELRVVKTHGDRITDLPLSQIGGKGVFVKEIEEALLNGEGDIAVHSLKDMPSVLPPSLVLAAVPEREDPRDALVLPAGAPPQEGPDGLPVRPGGRVGSSSLRRRAQLLAWRPDLTVADLRGNVDTRLRKLDAGEHDAIVLAAAGLRRLGLEARISVLLPVDRFVPMVGQGALAIETRQADARTLDLLAILDHPPTRAAVTAERAFLAHLEGDCRIPLGALATCDADRVNIIGMIANPEGQEIVRQSMTGTAGDAAALGERLAAALLDAGGARLQRQLKALGS